MSELKPCPFCGSTDIYKTSEPGYIDDSAIIFCNSCKISVKLEENDQEGYNDKTIAKAVDAWNRRVDIRVDNKDARVYELTEQLEELMDEALDKLDQQQFDIFIDQMEQIIVYYQDKNDDRW